MDKFCIVQSLMCFKILEHVLRYMILAEINSTIKVWRSQSRTGVLLYIYHRNIVDALKYQQRSLQ